MSANEPLEVKTCNRCTEREAILGFAHGVKAAPGTILQIVYLAMSLGPMEQEPSLEEGIQVVRS